MIRLNAYVLAADPTWLELSVGVYYDWVQEIVVSYDSSGKGWTGSPIPVQECLSRLRALDHKGKMRFEGGCFSSPADDPMVNDTLQRNAALASAGQGADWVLQLDTDEWLPNPVPFYAAIERADTLGLSGLEWPMRVLYRKIKSGALEVCSSQGRDHFEYIAPVAVRAGTHLVHSRRPERPFLRALVQGDQESVQLRSKPSALEVRETLLEAPDAIVHNSWARTPSDLRRKLASWSHSSWRAWLYYATRWLPAKWTWRWMRNLHPFFGGVWPALRVCQIALPDRVRVGLAKNPRKTATRNAAAGSDSLTVEH